MRPEGFYVNEKSMRYYVELFTHHSKERHPCGVLVMRRCFEESVLYSFLVVSDLSIFIQNCILHDGDGPLNNEYTRGRLRMYVQGRPAEIQAPRQWNLTACNMTAPSPVMLSPSSALLPSFSSLYFVRMQQT